VIRFQCTCGKRLKVDDSSAGRKVKCSMCGKELIAPVASQAAGGDLDALAQAMQASAPKAAGGPMAVKTPGRPNGGLLAKNKPGAAKKPNNTSLYVGLGVAGGVLLIIFIAIVVAANRGGETPRPKPTVVITPDASVKPRRAHTPGELFPNVEPQNN
jgi:hypothetical protein